MDISGKTKIYALLGHPIAHSISPQIHNAAFDALGLDCRYVCFDVTPDSLRDAISGLRALGVQGFNLTMPLKMIVPDLLDGLSPAAQISGAVNTVSVEDGRLIGHNTDGLGFVRGLREAGFEPAGKRISILGRGGAARAIAAQLQLDGAGQVSMLGRGESEKAAQAHLLVNATPVGMSPDSGATPVDAALLSPDQFVADVIYAPCETRLLREARQLGCRTVGGLPMLLYQGAEAFRIWTGKEMPDNVLHALKERLR